MTSAVMTNATQKTLEKRRSPRVTPEPDQPVGIHLIGQDYVEVTNAINVSIEGIGICVPHGFHDVNLDKLAEVLIKLPEPVDCSFTATVKIAHRQGNNFGAQFMDIAEKDAKMLHAYIMKLMKKRLDSLA